jgi:hypothetical protein
MWQIHWVIGLIPDTVLVKIYYTFLISGAVLYFGSKLFKHFPFRLIPFLGQYPRLSDLLGVVLMVISIYLLGSYGNEMLWQAKIKEAEDKVAVAEKASADANAKLEIEHNKKEALLTERKILYKERIKKEIVRIDSECKLDLVVPKIHNDAAKNPYRKGDAK